MKDKKYIEKSYALLAAYKRQLGMEIVDVEAIMGKLEIMMDVSRYQCTLLRTAGIKMADSRETY